MDYGCSLVEAAKRLQVDQATVLIAMQRGAIPTRYQNGRPVLTSSALAEYKLRSSR
ncbi:hypothetical protein ACQ4M3_26050 [Leptolyngbya sp. AN03gr2]|uniref:hypothetical protein n=1 Tax=unclassified Leptolyngbya TaxID=2650499 RepID=UPI003D3133A6